MGRITILTVGSRGDVQPYCAIALDLIRRGHQVSLGGSPDFADFVSGLGIDFSPVGGSFKQFMSSSEGLDILEGKKANSPTDERLWHQLLDAWQVSQASDLIVYSPLATWGYHIAEALRVPGILASPIPLAPTGAFPLLNFARQSDNRLIKLLNRLSYRLAYVLSWRGKATILNQFRHDVLGLPKISSWRGPLYGQQTALPMSSLPILNCYSEAVIPTPADWGESVHQGGYCFLDSETEFTPPAGLQEFLRGSPKPFYVGFGSMISRNPEQLAQTIIDAIVQTGQRAVLCTGWGDFSLSELPDSIYSIPEVPHDWLFPRVAAAIHHGGAGTTAATLRAGIPSIAVPFFADQPVWAKRLEQLGVCPAVHPRLEIETDQLVASIRTLLAQDDFYVRSQQIKEQIEAEDGTANAAGIIESYLGKDIYRSRA